MSKKLSVINNKKSISFSLQLQRSILHLWRPNLVTLSSTLTTLAPRVSTIPTTSLSPSILSSTCSSCIHWIVQLTSIYSKHSFHLVFLYLQVLALQLILWNVVILHPIYVILISFPYNGFIKIKLPTINQIYASNYDYKFLIFLRKAIFSSWMVGPYTLVIELLMYFWS